MKYKITILNIVFFSNLLNLRLNAQSPSIYIGRINSQFLKESPYNEWFKKPLFPIIPDSSVQYNKDFNRYKALLVLGTWCEDSHQYVPEILEYFDNLKGFNNLETFCVDRDKICSQCPTDIKVQKIPLLIILKDNIEIARMEESPPKNVKHFLDNTLRGN